MNSTTHYLYKTALIILDIWDEVAAVASPFVPTDVSPSPPPAASSHLAEDEQMIAPSKPCLDDTNRNWRLMTVKVMICSMLQTSSIWSSLMRWTPLSPPTSSFTRLPVKKD